MAALFLARRYRAAAMAQVAGPGIFSCRAAAICHDAGDGWLCPGRIGELPADTPLAVISGSRGIGFVLTVQGRAIILFATFFVWAFRTRLSRPDTHKRMMFLATWALIDAGIGRIPGSNELGAALGLLDIGLTSMDDISHVWMLAALLPAFL